MSQLPGMVMLGRREVNRSPSPIITPVDELPQLGHHQPYSTQVAVRESLVSHSKVCFVNYDSQPRFKNTD